jgi:hypothetical protein
VVALVATLAVGGPNLVFGEGWDAAPVLFVVALLVLMHWVQIPPRTPAIISAIAAGLLLDLLTDAYDVSLLTALSILTFVFGVVALRRTSAR